MPERLEERRLLAFDLVAAYVQPDEPFFVKNVTAGDVTLDVAPQQITLRFSPGVRIDPASLGAGIALVRSGAAGDSFGPGGTAADVPVALGSITVNDIPNQNEVVLRFAETLPDDSYRITVRGDTNLLDSTIDGLRNQPSPPVALDSFLDGGQYAFDFQLDLGAHVVSVVPQPVIRAKTIDVRALPADGDLLAVSVRGRRMVLEFDSNATAAAAHTPVAFTGSDTPTTIAQKVRAALLSGAGGTPAAVFGAPSELADVTIAGAVLTVTGTSFTPVVTATRSGTALAASVVTVGDGALAQKRDTVVVHFNANDPLDPASATNPANYRLFDTERTTAADRSVVRPTSVSYHAGSATAVLSFAPGAVADDRLYRLQVGNSADVNATALSAVNVGTIFARPVPATPAYATVAFLGDDPAVGADDVDLYKLRLTAAGTLTVTLTPGATLDVLPRLFAENGTAITAGVVVIGTGAGNPKTLTFTAPAAGTFVLGVSSVGNAAYTTAGAGATGGLSTGSYALAIASDVPVPAGDDNSSFVSAAGVGTLGVGGLVVSAAIDVRPDVATPIGSLGFPHQFGALDSVGHRDTPIEAHGVPGRTGTTAATAIPVVPYNFRSDYGADPQGNPLINSITETQKTRAREIFDIYSRAAGVRFVETASEGLTIVTGDMRALSPGISTAPAGLAGSGMAIMDSTEDWGASEFGGYWFQVAMHEIGHILNLEHSYDIASIMGRAEAPTDGLLPTEPVFPGNYDIEHLLQLFPNNGSDIDVYSFQLPVDGRLTAETFVSRPGAPVTSHLDTVITVYRESPAGTRELIARNDDYFGRDSFVGIDLQARDGAGASYTYYVAVTSTGNTSFNPEVPDSGYGGRTDGAYELRLGLDPVVPDAATILDSSGTQFDGDRDGVAGGALDFWFNTATTAATVFVDKAAAPGGTGTLAAPYAEIDLALAAVNAANAAAAGSRTIVRIVGSDGNAATLADDRAYLVGRSAGDTGTVLADGATFNVPRGVTVMIDEGALLKLRGAVIDVGSSSEVPTETRAGAALQVLGTPGREVRLTSYHDDQWGGDSDGVGPVATGGQWGGIVFREDADAASRRSFVDTVTNAALRFGGGQVIVDSQRQTFTPIQIEGTRPTIAFNRITSGAGAAISATPASFADADGRIGPEFRGNVLLDNSINGLFVRIPSAAGSGLSRLDVPARFAATDIVHVIAENLVLDGGAGGYVRSGGQDYARATGRLTIDPGVVVKVTGTRIELDRGNARLYAEGLPGRDVIVTSLADNRYGAGGTFDTNGNQPDVPRAGDWGGIVVNAGGAASIDRAYVGFGGGTTAIEGGFAKFNVFEVHQGDLRLVNSRVEHAADGYSPAAGDRTGRGENTAATIFVRGAQPVIVGNDFRSNRGALVSVNANALDDRLVGDPGRSTGPIARSSAYDDNFGPLVRGNVISAAIDPESRRRGDFAISLAIDPSLPQSVVRAAQTAAARWESIIVGDLTPAINPATGLPIDDILITVRPGLLGSPTTDGAGGTLANAGPTNSRPAGDVNRHLPFMAQVGVDLADVGRDDLTTVMIHEFAHALGLTSVSQTLGLIQGSTYVGANAVREYQALGAATSFVPLETGGGSGTALAHWDEVTFDYELMTGFIDPGFNPLSRMTVGAFADMGYVVSYDAADPYILPADARGTIDSVAGLVVRGEEITVEGVWDDTDMVHVLRNEVLVNNFHTATGLRLMSRADASLVVKLFGDAAGLTASGFGLDIDDRIGGTVQVLGQPGYPVILTSLHDDTAYASLDPLGRPMRDTNNDGTATIPGAGDWRGLEFLPMSNDRNVAIDREAEPGVTGALDANGVLDAAQRLGTLAPNHAAANSLGTLNSWESSQEKGGDENRRLGFEIHGTIALDDPGDVDVYAFRGYAGSEVWIDIDKTSAALDTMVELLDGNGNVLARSADAQTDMGSVRADAPDVAGQNPGAGTTRTVPLAHGNILPGTLSGVVYEDNTAIQTFTVDRAGTFTFTRIGNPVSEALGGATGTRAVLARDTGVITLPFDVAPAGTIRVEAAYDFARLPLATLGFDAVGNFGAYPLAKDQWRGNDHYSLNPRDAGMRVILPGVVGSTTANQYFVRVRSQPAYGAATTPAAYAADLADPALVGAGATSGRYELRVRLRQQDEKPGSTVRYADIRYPVVGIDVVGLPRNSPLVGETGEHPTDANGTFGASSQQVGNLLTADRNTISVGGALSGEGDIDWYSFTLDYASIQSIGGVNNGAKTWATVFDIDYADGFRGDLTLSVFDAQGRLLYVGRDSNIADDQPAAGQGNDFDDLSRGSLGKLDPFIGSVQMPAGGPGSTTRYYVAVSSNERLPQALDAYFTGSPLNSQIRLEPINSVRRVVDDRIGSTGYTAWSPFLVAAETSAFTQPAGGAIIDTSTALTLSAHARPFTLADVTLFVSSSSSLFTADAFRGGAWETRIANNAYTGGAVGDIDMRTDGRLFQYFGANNDAANNGLLREIDTATGGVLSTVGDGISNDPTTPTFWQVSGQSVDALAIRRRDVANYTDGVFYSIRDGGDSYLYTTFGAGTVDFNGTAPDTIRTQMTGGTTGRTGTLTGLQHQSESGTLYGLTSTGQFFPTSGGPGFDADFSAVLTGGETFEGLATAPVNVEGGRFAGMFFAITSAGRLVCINPLTNSLVANVFDTDGDGYADSHVSSAITGTGNVTGLAFSPLDINLWHPTIRRGDVSGDSVTASDAGHGVHSTATVDNTRATNSGNVSMYFGLEQYRTSGDYAGYQYGGTGQYGTVSGGTYNWQQDLTANTAIGNNYNLPGGAYGSLITNPFSLAGYATTDKPTLYFSYFLETQDASGRNDEMRDSARVFASTDDGRTWTLLATNNQSRSDNDGDAPEAELPHTLSVSSAIGSATNQHVQELFDTASWRQARVDLGKWAGESSIRLRFDFSTAGEMDPTDRSRFTPDTIQTVAAGGATAGSAEVTLSSVEGLQVGMFVQSPLDVAAIDDTGAAVAQRVAPGATITAIDPLTRRITLSDPVGDATGLASSQLRFFRATADLLNDIAGRAGTTGNFRGNDSSRDRGANNAFEGFYVDDIIVGFAERGEMVTGAATGQTDFFDLQTPIANEYFQQVLQGAYQLEIRRGTEYAVQPDPLFSQTGIVQLIDTNDRLVRDPAATVLVLEENALTALGGAVTHRGSGTRTALTTPTPGILMAGTGAATSAVEHNAVFWTVDLASQPSAFLDFQYGTVAVTNPVRREALTPLPATFTLDDSNRLPTGDGIAVSTDNGVNWTTIGGFTATNNTLRRAVLDLTSAGALTAQTVIGFFQSGPQDAANGGGILVTDAVITTAPRVATTGLVGDRNLVREQGQFVIDGNIVAHAEQYGIRIDAGARDAGTNAPHPGVVRNLPVLNNDRTAPGAVVVNNIITASGTAGLLFSGQAFATNLPAAVVPFGRIVNNTFSGNPAAPGGTGVQVTDNAGPTLLNNLFANLTTGVNVVDTGSRAASVVAYSAYWNTGTRVVGVTETDAIQLVADPFVDAAVGNYYLAAGSLAIDSSLNTLQDRSAFRNVKDAVGIPESPVFAPELDLYGQLRQDDPAVAGGSSGLGSEVFIDRGAVDRVDFTQPTLAIATPLDNAPADQDPSPAIVRLEESAAVGLTQFVLQLADVGIGIDDATVTSAAFTIRYSPAAGVTNWDDDDAVQTWLEGTNYLFRYLENTKTVVFEAPSVFPLGEYRITVDNSAATGVRDRAGGRLLNNDVAGTGTTAFEIMLIDLPGVPTGLAGTPTQGSTQVSLTFAAPANAGGSRLADYVVQYVTDAAYLLDPASPGWQSFADGVSTTTGVTVTGLIDGTAYRFRVAAQNEHLQGGWTAPTGPIAPMRVPTVALENDLGPSSTDGITSDPTVAVGGIETGATWQYSVDAGATWLPATPLADTVGSFDLAAGDYAAGDVRVRQTLLGFTSAVGENAGDLSIRTTVPTVAIDSVIDDVAPVTGDVADGGHTNDASLALAGSTSAVVTAVEVSDGTTWFDQDDGVVLDPSGTAWSFVTTGLADGTTYVFSARVTDIAGIVATSPTRTVTVDLTAPTAPVLGLPTTTGAGLANSNVVTVSGLEAGIPWQYSLDGGTTWQTGTGTQFTLADAFYDVGRIRARQTDLAGNVSPQAASDAAFTVAASVVVTSGSFSSFSATYGTASAAQSIVVSGSNLTDDVVVAVPDGFEISLTADSGYGTLPLELAPDALGILGQTTIHVRLAAGASVGTYSGDVTLTAPMATAQALAIPTSTILARQLTISGLSAADRAYDRTTSVTVTGTAVLEGVVGIDDVTLSGTPAYAFADAAAGTAKLIVITGWSLAGTDAGNYELDLPELTASITRVVLTVTGLDVADRTYDGTTDAAVSGTLAGIVAGDEGLVTLAATGTFDTKDAGTDKPVTLGLEGPAAGNYSVATASATITAAPLTVTANDVTKRRGVALASGQPSTGFVASGLVAGEAIGTVVISYTDGASAAAALGTYADAVVPSAPTGGSFAAGNYAITFVTGDLVVVEGFNPGGLVVARIGDGSVTTSTTAGRVSLVEYTPTAGATPTSTVTFDTTGAERLTDSSAPLSGYFNAYEGYVAVGSHDAAAGTTSVVSLDNKATAILGVTGELESRVAYPTGGAAASPPSPFAGGQLRSVIPTGPTTFYAAGSSGTTPDRGGVWHYDGTQFVRLSPATQVSAPRNLRNVEIYGDELYVSTSETNLAGIWRVGTALPTAADSGLLTRTINTGTGSSPIGFVLFDTDGVVGPDVAYVADSRTQTGGGLQKWVLAGNVWSLSWSRLLGTSGFSATQATGFVGLSGLAGSYDAATGTATLYATALDGYDNRLVAVTDTVAATTAPSSFVLIARAGANNVFRGVDLSPGIAADVEVTAGLTAFATTYGTASAAQSFTITASNTTSDLLVTAPDGFEVSVEANAGFGPSLVLARDPVDGTVAENVFLRVRSAATAGDYANRSVTISQEGQTVGTVAVPASNVARRTLTVSGAAAQNKNFDGTTAATITGAALVNVVAGDDVTVSGGGTFASPNPGTAIPVTAGLVLDGTAAANYQLTQPTGLTADIVAVTSTDVSTLRLATGLTALVAPGGGGAFTFGLNNAGDEAVVADFLGWTLGIQIIAAAGATGSVSLGTLSQPAIAPMPVGTAVFAEPTPLSLAGGASLNGSTSYVQLGGQSEDQAGTVPAGATFNMGELGITASGDAFGTWNVYVVQQGGANYRSHWTTFATQADLDFANLPRSAGNASLLVGTIVVGAPSLVTTGTLAGLSTTYGQASGTTSLTVDGTFLTGDIVAAAPAGFEVSVDGVTFGQTVTFVRSGGTAGGTLRVRLSADADAGTYSGNVTLTSPGLATVSVPTVASTVAKRGLTVTGLSAASRPYDGTTAATVSGTAALFGVLGRDQGQVQLGGTPTAAFNSKDVATATTVAMSGFALLGARADNYALTQPALPAGILARSLVVRGDHATRLVNTANPAATATIMGFVNGETAATALTGAPSFSTAATVASPVGTYPITVAAGTLAALGGNYTFDAFVAGALTVTNPPVQVTGVFVRGSAWTDTYFTRVPALVTDGVKLGWSLRDGANQLATSGANAAQVTWNNVNTISVRFDQPIALPAASAARLLRGAAGGDEVIVPTGVSLLAGGTIAQFTLATPLANGKYVLAIASTGITDAAGSTALDGEWSQSVTTFATGSGNDVAGGGFNFAFNVLVGDLNANGSANTNDTTLLRSQITNAFGTPVTPAIFRSDVNGNGVLNSLDVSALRASLTSLSAFGISLNSFPAATPPQPASPTISAPTFAGVTTSAAALGGTVSSDGGEPVLRRGVVLIAGDSGDPTLDTTGALVFLSGGGTGTFTTLAAGLRPSQAYRFRAFVTTSLGTVYTTTASFTTPAA